MAKAKAKTPAKKAAPAAKPAAAKKADLSGYGKKPYKVGADVILNAHVAGCRPGAFCEVTEIKHGGAMFCVKVAKGPGAEDGDKPAKTFQVWANQLN